MENRHLPSLLLVFGVFIATITACHFLIAALPANPWEGWALGKSGTYQEYCELNDLAATIRQPANSWSNFFFFFFGLLILRDVWLDRRSSQPKSLVKASYGYGVVLALTFFCLTFGSFLFHASLTRIGQRWDMTFTYGLAATLLAGVTYRLGHPRLWKRGPRSQATLVGLIVLIQTLFYTFKWYLNAKLVLGGMFVAIVLIALYLQISQYKRFKLTLSLLAFSSLIAAIVIRELDVAKVGCDPESIFQGHALWHLLAGLSAYFSFQFLRQEKVNPTDN